MTTTTEKTTQDYIDEDRARRDAYHASHQNELFLGYDNVVCASLGCAGMTLYSDIINNPNRRNFHGLRNEIYTKLSESNRQDLRDAYAPLEQTCECGKVTL